MLTKESGLSLAILAASEATNLRFSYSKRLEPTAFFKQPFQIFTTVSLIPFVVGEAGVLKMKRLVNLSNAGGKSSQLISTSIFRNSLEALINCFALSQNIILNAPLILTSSLKAAITCCVVAPGHNIAVICRVCKHEIINTNVLMIGFAHSFSQACAAVHLNGPAKSMPQI